MNRATFPTIYATLIIALAALYTLTAAYNAAHTATSLQPVNTTPPATPEAQTAAHTAKPSHSTTTVNITVDAYAEIYVNGRLVANITDPITINMERLVWYMIVGTQNPVTVYTAGGGTATLCGPLYATERYIILINETNAEYSFTHTTVTAAVKLPVSITVANNTVYMIAGAILDQPVNVTAIGILALFECGTSTPRTIGNLLLTYDPLQETLRLNAGDNITVAYKLIFPSDYMAAAFGNVLTGRWGITGGTYKFLVYTYDPLQNETCSMQIGFNSKEYNKTTYMSIVGLAYTFSTCEGYVTNIVIQHEYVYKSGYYWTYGGYVTTVNITVSSVGFRVSQGDPFAVVVEFRVPIPGG